MSEEQQVEVSEELDYKALYEKAQKDVEILAAKKEELYKETKAAKKERELQAIAEQEKAKKAGEFEKLWQSSEESRKALEQELQNERTQYKQEKIQANAMKIAIELADGHAQSAKLLANFVEQSLSKLADDRGTIDDTVLSAVRKEFQNNADYAPLLAGSKANGGGALGAGNGVAKQNTIDRKAFNDMTPQQQREFVVKQKGQVIDN